MPQIVVNGKLYSSLDEMPPDIRQTYEQTLGMLADRNQNGVPDIVEGALGTAGCFDVQATPILINRTQISVDGKMVSSVDDLSLEAREKYEQALTKLGQVMVDTDRNGVPDILEGRQSKAAGMTSSIPKPVAAVPLAETPAVVISDGKPNQSCLLLAGIVIVALVGILILLGVFQVIPLFK